MNNRFRERRASREVVWLGWVWKWIGCVPIGHGVLAGRWGRPRQWWWNGWNGSRDRHRSGSGYTLTATTAVSVLNFTPAFTVFGGTSHAASGVPATLTANLTDPTGSGVSYSVDFGDGTSGPIYSPDATHAFVFNPDANGNDSSTYTITAQDCLTPRNLWMKAA